MHKPDGPLTVPEESGALGVGVTGSRRGELVPQIFAAVTSTSPVKLPTVTKMRLVFCPEVITQSAGTDQL